jgi:hypothetical protein
VEQRIHHPAQLGRNIASQENVLLVKVNNCRFKNVSVSGENMYSALEWYSFGLFVAETVKEFL